MDDTRHCGNTVFNNSLAESEMNRVVDERKTGNSLLLLTRALLERTWSIMRAIRSMFDAYVNMHPKALLLPSALKIVQRNKTNLNLYNF